MSAVRERFTHPREIPAEDFLKPADVTPYRLARAIAIPQTHFGEIITGKRAVMADMGLRLFRFLGKSEE